MTSTIQPKTITPLLLITLALFCLGLLPKAQAVSPPPDGGYPGGNTAEGQSALLSRTTGLYNTAVGIFSVLSLTDGNFCTGVGAGTLLLNTADENTATGAGALFSNTSGDRNTANGAFALFTNTEGINNTATGASALQSNTTGDANTATGASALFSNTTGINNTANGTFALFSNTDGGDNTANGHEALFSNTGEDNTASGFQALFSNTGGQANTATGEFALFSNTIGGFNTAIGEDALVNNTTGTGNIALGAEAGSNLTTGNNNIDIGTFGVAGESNTIRIGNQGTHTATFIAGISGVDEGSPTAVFINTATGQLGTTPAASSRRFKKEIKPMDKASEAILALKPVTFHYKSDKIGTPQFGLIAEEVAQVNPDLVVRDKNGEVYTVRYDQVNAMLLNEFLKAHRAIEDQRKEIDTLKTQLKEQVALIQRVSDKVDLDQSMRQLVANEQ